MWLKAKTKKVVSKPKALRPVQGFKVVSPPKSAHQRSLLSEPGIETSGGARTVHGQPAGVQ